MSAVFGAGWFGGGCERWCRSCLVDGAGWFGSALFGVRRLGGERCARGCLVDGAALLGAG